MTRRSSILSKWDQTTIGIEDIRPELERRLRQRPPHVAVSSKTGRGDRAARSTRSSGCSTKHTARVPTSELNRFLAELRDAPAAAVEERQASQPSLRLAGDDEAAALPAVRQRPASDHTRLRLLGREPVSRAFRARGRSRHDRLREAFVNVVVVGGGSWGTAFACVLRHRGHDVTLACRDPEQARAIAETGQQPALPHYRRPERDRGDDHRRSAARGDRADRARRSEPRVRRRRCGAARRRAGAEPDERPRPGDRRAALHARDGSAGRGAVRPEHGRGGRRRPAVRDGDRERGPASSPSACRRRSTRSSSASTSTRTSSASSSAPRRRT